MAPLPGTRVIPKDWAAHHRPTVAGTWTATCTIRRPGGTAGDFDEETGKRPIEPYAAHYDGPCRVQAMVDAGEREAAGQQVTVAGYLVVVERDTSAETEVGHVVKITAVDDNGHPDLVGRELTVTGVVYGSLAFERDLTCNADLG